MRGSYQNSSAKICSGSRTVFVVCGFVCQFCLSVLGLVAICFILMRCFCFHLYVSISVCGFVLCRAKCGVVEVGLQTKIIFCLIG